MQFLVGISRILVKVYILKIEINKMNYNKKKVQIFVPF